MAHSASAQRSKQLVPQWQIMTDPLQLPIAAHRLTTHASNKGGRWPRTSGHLVTILLNGNWLIHGNYGSGCFWRVHHRRTDHVYLRSKNKDVLRLRVAWIQSKVALSRCPRSVPSLGMCESVLKHPILHHFDHQAAQENPTRCRKKHAKTNNGRKCAAICAALAIYMTIHNWFVFDILQAITYQRVRWDHRVTCFGHWKH